MSPYVTAQELTAILRLVLVKAIIVHSTMLNVLTEALELVGTDVPIPHLWMMDRANGNIKHKSIFDLVKLGQKHAKPFAKLFQPAQNTLALVPFSR